MTTSQETINGLIEAAAEGVADVQKKLELALKLIDNLQDVTPDPESKFGTFRLGERSLKRLEGVHPDMLAVVHYAIRVTTLDFGITRTGGLRTLATQHRLMGKGASKTLRSRHLTGHAVDIAAIHPETGRSTWEPLQVMKVHEAFESASTALDVPLRWGGNWNRNGDIREKGETDLVHHELPRDLYRENKFSQSKKAAEFLERIRMEAQA